MTEQQQKSWSKGAAAWGYSTLLIVGLLVIVGFIITDAVADEPTSTTTTMVTPDTTVAPDTEVAACDPQEAITWGMGQLGFAPEDLRFEGNFDLGAAGVKDANNGSFGSTAIVTKNQLFAMFSSSEQAAVTATNYMLAQLPAEERENALSNPSRWVGVQMMVPIVFTGNTYYINGVAQDSDSIRHVASGDIWWFYVDMDCGIHISAAVRGACNNPQSEPPKPVEPKPVPTTTRPPETTTTRPPETTTTRPPETTTTRPPETTTTRPPETTTTKDPCLSPVNQPSCGDAPDDDPRNDPSGTQPPRPSTTTTTRAPHIVDPPADSGSGAINTTIPPTTVAPAPAPPVTTSPTVVITPP